MKTICSFCNTIINPGTSPDDPVSHGVCQPCYKRIITQYGLDVQKFLNMLEAPVFLVDDDVNILAANTLAIAAIKKPVEMVSGKLCGNVIECVNSLLPGGCGKTPLCPDCGIRSSVNETYRTGKEIIRHPAVIIRRIEGIDETLHILVTTKKDGDVVLLRLELIEAA